MHVWPPRQSRLNPHFRDFGLLGQAGVPVPWRERRLRLGHNHRRGGFETHPVVVGRKPIHACMARPRQSRLNPHFRDFGLLGQAGVPVPWREWRLRLGHNHRRGGFETHPVVVGRKPIHACMARSRQSRLNPHFRDFGLLGQAGVPYRGGNEGGGASRGRPSETSARGAGEGRPSQAGCASEGDGSGRSGASGYSDVALLGVWRNWNRSLSAGRTSVVPSVRKIRYAWRLRVKA